MSAEERERRGAEAGAGMDAASHGGKVNKFFLQYIKCDVNNALARVVAAAGEWGSLVAPPAGAGRLGGGEGGMV